MHETRADTTRAVVSAVLLHVVLFGLMFIGLFWTRASAPVSAAGAPVSAELIDADALSPAMQRTLRNRPKPVEELPPPPEPEEAAPLPQPLPEPLPQDSVAPPQQEAQDFIPVPDTENQEAVVETPTPTPAEEKKAQELKRRQEQVDLTEQKRQQEVEQKRRLAEQQEQERQQKIAEIRKKREAAAREANLAEQRLRQIADVRARQGATAAAGAATGGETSPPAGTGGTDTGLQARYIAALQAAILPKWTRPETVPIGSRCTVHIRQMAGGQVMDATAVEPCAYDDAGRRSIEAAVLKAQPLPYAGFEKVFARDMKVTFTAQEY